MLVIMNATILTMEDHDHSDLITDGVLVSKSGVIESVGNAKDVVIPKGATVINAQGGLYLCCQA